MLHRGEERSGEVADEYLVSEASVVIPAKGSQ